MNPEIRGSGRTHRQMREAPQGATFVWCNDQSYLAKIIAANAERYDLKIVPLSWVLDDPARLRGLRDVIFDHACPPTDRLTRAMEFAAAHCRGSQ